MTKRTVFSIFLLTSSVWIAFALTPLAPAQQTLGGITGTVTDSSGGVLADTTVTLVGDQTGLTRTQKTTQVGSYDFVNLPIGSYTLTFTHDGFQTLKIPSITVQADRTATVNTALKVGQVGTTVTVEETPLINAVDTTNGYILEKEQIESVPLPTGSFTGLAILSPGVSAELPGGTGVNAGQGNQPIWANGQRDTSNSFLLNGVDASNLFNGKSTSQVASARIINNTGAVNQLGGNGVTQTAASPYLAIGQALPTPAPESIAELRVNTSMYDAQQGSTSGAHIDMSTASGTNDIHGSLYLHRGTNWLNAAPFFFNEDTNIPADQKVPGLHRYTAGGTVGAPIKKDKLFAFLSYQHTHVSDDELGISRLTVPHGLNASNRTADGLAALANANFGTSLTAAQIDPIALALFQFKLPNGQFLMPNDTGRIPTQSITDNAISPGTARFWSDQAVANLDWNASSKDTLQLKYYYQHDPTIAPYANSNVPGFDDHLDAGSHVASITNTQMLKPNLSVTEVFGFLREKIYSTNSQLFTPQQLGINEFGSTFFPGISIVDVYGNGSPNNPNGVFNAPLTIGPGAFSQNALTGVFQNRFMPSANAIWTLGKHTLTFGGSFSYTQLNVRDNRTGTGMIATPNLATFLQGLVTLYSPNGFVSTAYLQGDANRYYRANQTGTYVQDKFQLRSNLSVTAGLRFDWNGGLKEKYGRIYNFDPSQYAFDETSGTVTSTGFIIAGNNKLFPTKGVSDTTLTGRQWGLAPRVGVAWSPAMFHGKLVVRAGAGLYYDRGELFSYLSPGFAAGEITGGPFGVNQTPPFVNSQVCNSTFTFEGFIPVCNLTSASLANPWGPTRGPAPSGNPADIINFLPSRTAIESGAQVFPFAVYDRGNKLPYTINDTLDIQWQPRNDLAIEIGYVGNLGRHQVIPVPFNQAGIATPTKPIHGQQYTYGYQVVDSTFTPIQLPNGQGPFLNTFEGGNIDLRVPFVGYSAESESYKAAGVSAYNALQTHIEKRLSHGLQAGFSYTYSHALDEQSAMGLFFTGNNPLSLRDGYASSDFDRTHVFNFNYLYQLPKFFSDSEWKGKLADGWAVSGIAVFQSGQPYSIVDFSGAVGSAFYGVSDGITNPIVPLGNGCTPKTALTGSNGIDSPALKASCFAIPLLNPGDLNGAIPAGDPYETNFTTGQRNIFRQSWQKRADISLIKVTKLTERLSMRFSFEVFNLTNTPSFDIPKADVTQNANFNGFPTAGKPPLPTSCDSTNAGFYNCPTSLGTVTNTIGSPRQIQMTLRLLF
jgi:hypothetical protein